MNIYALPERAFLSPTSTALSDENPMLCPSKPILVVILQELILDSYPTIIPMNDLISKSLFQLNFTGFHA